MYTYLTAGHAVETSSRQQSRFHIPNKLLLVFAVLLLIICSPATYGAQGIIFNGTSQYASGTTSSALTSQGAFRIEMRLRGLNRTPSATAYIVNIDNVLNLYMGTNGTLQFQFVPNSTYAWVTPTSNDMLVRIQFDPANSRTTLETWNLDGTGRLVATQPATATTVNMASRAVGYGAANFGALFAAVRVDYLRIINGAVSLNSTPPTDTAPASGIHYYEFEGVGTDSVGTSHLTLNGSPTFESTPCAAGVQGIIFNGTTQFANGTTSSSLTNQGAFRIEARLRGLVTPTSTSGYIVNIDNVLNLYISTNGTLQFQFIPASTYAWVNTTSSDMLVRVQFDPVNSRTSLETWNLDGTGRQEATQPTTVSTVNMASRAMGYGAANFGALFAPVRMDYARIVNGAVSLNSSPPADTAPASCIHCYEFEGNGLDSASTSNLTLNGSPLFENTSCSGPALSLSAPTASYVNEAVIIDARNSNGVSRLPQTNGSPSVTIDFGDGFKCYTLACGHAYRSAGSYTITLTGKSDAGATSTTTANITVSNVPAATGTNVQTLTNTGNSTTNATNLQNAVIVAAQNNSVEQEIVLPATFVVKGPIELTAPNGLNSGNKYITIKSQNLASLPVNGNRVATTDGANMPTIQAPSSVAQGTSAVRTPQNGPASPSHHYRFQGIHFKKDVDANISNVFMELGVIDVAQNTIPKIPHHFIIERCWFEGSSASNYRTINAIRIAADNVTVADSLLLDFRQIQEGGVDAATISIVNSQGPYSIVNNTMVATDEGMMFGGDYGHVQFPGSVTNPTTTSATLSSTTGLAVDSDISFVVGGAYSANSTTIVRSVSGNNITFDAIPTAPDNNSTAKWGAQPSFAEVRRNHIFKRLSWWASHSSYANVNWQIKNLFEIKRARYVQLEGNILEKTWREDQWFAIVLAPRNQEGASPFAVVREIYFVNNKIQNVGGGVSLLISDETIGKPSGRASDITFRNNLFQNIGYNWDALPPGHFFQMILGGEGISLHGSRYHLIHNTIDQSANPSADHYGETVDIGTGKYVDDARWLDNAINRPFRAFGSSGFAEGTATINEYFAPGAPTTWNKNLITGVANTGLTYPSQGIYPTTSWSAQFVNYAIGDFTLAPLSLGKGSALDGSDVGVNVTALNSATLHATDGIWVQP